MILVVGATGLLGKEICLQLRAAGQEVVGLIRTGSPGVRDLEDAGVKTRLGDLKEPESLRQACRGVATVISTASCTLRARSGDTLATVDRDGQLALVEAAGGCGVRRFVYVSVSPGSQDCALVRYKRRVETALRQSAMEWVILQPCAFMDIWFSKLVGWDTAAGRASLVGKGDQPVSYISIRDVAQFAVAGATGPDLVRRSTPLGGPEALDRRQVLEVFEDVTGRRFRIRRLPVGLFRDLAWLLRPAAPKISSLLSLTVGTAERGDAIDMSETLARVPLRLTSLREWASASSTPS